MVYRGCVRRSLRLRLANRKVLGKERRKKGGRKEGGSASNEGVVDEHVKEKCVACNMTTIRNAHEKKIKANMSRYLKWESQQNDRMSRTIDGIKAAFEVMDYWEVKRAWRKRGSRGSGGREEAKVQVEDETFRSSGLELKMLADVFDFAHFERDHGLIVSPVKSASNRTWSSDDFYVDDSGNQPEMNAEETEKENSDIDIFENRKEGQNRVRKKKYRSMFLDVEGYKGINLLGMPPPVEVVPSISHQGFELKDSRRSIEAKILLHDLISGDICDV